jgi:hypothetical protein
MRKRRTIRTIQRNKNTCVGASHGGLLKMKWGSSWRVSWSWSWSWSWRSFFGTPTPHSSRLVGIRWDDSHGSHPPPASEIEFPADLQPPKSSSQPLATTRHPSPSRLDIITIQTPQVTRHRRDSAEIKHKSHIDSPGQPSPPR